MRYIEITIPDGQRRAVLDVLEAEGVDYIVSDEVGRQEHDAAVRFPLPTRAVEGVLDRLSEADLSGARVVVIDAETVVSEEFDELRERHSHGGTRVNGPRGRYSRRKPTNSRPRSGSTSSCC